MKIGFSAILTGEVLSEACLGCDHPLRSGLTENSHRAFGLLAQSSKPAAQMTDHGVHFLVRKPAILTQDKL